MEPQQFIDQLMALPEITAQTQFLQERVRLLGETPFADAVAERLKRQADYFVRTDLDQSWRMVKLLYAAADLTGNALYRALGLRAEGNALRFSGLGDSTQAIACYDRAAEIYLAQGLVVDAAESQTGKIGVLANLGQYDEALKTCEQIGQVLERHGRWQRLVQLKINLGIIYGNQQENVLALAAYEQAGDLARRIGEEGQDSIPLIETNRAIYLHNLGRLKEAIRASQVAIEVGTQLGQSAEVARAQENLALIYSTIGRLNEALQLWQQARETFMADNRQRDALLVDLDTNECLLQMRHLTQVLGKCREAQALAVAIGARIQLEQSILQEAAAYTGLRHYAESLAALTRVRELFEQDASVMGIVTTDLQIAAVLRLQGQPQTSLQMAQQCADTFRSANMPIYAAQAYLIAARAAADAGQPDLAFALTEQAAWDEVPALVYERHALRGALLATTGDLEQALVEYEQAIGQLEVWRGRLMLEFRAGFLEDKQSIYEEAVQLCVNARQPARAFDYAQRAKSRTLIDLLAHQFDLSLQPRNDSDKTLIGELQRLQAERNQLLIGLERQSHDRFDAQAAHDEARRQAWQALMAVEKRIADHWHTLLVRNADYAREAELWQAHAEPIRPLLAGTILLEYFIAGRNVYAFVATAETLEVRLLPANLVKIQQLLQLLQLNFGSVAGMLRQKTTGKQVAHLIANAQNLLRQLYDLLIAPINDRLADGHHPGRSPQVIIVPHGLLHYVPFHALYDGRSYVLEHYEVSYLPNASLLRYKTASGLRTGQLPAIAFGYSNHGQLPYAVEEALAVAARLDGQAFVEEQATLAHLRQAAARCTVLHLAAHGDFRPDNPLFSSLTLADGQLTTLDIFNLRLPVSLVTLSACQTGRSVIGGGDELLGLMRAFLYAGAASLLLSLWTVEDRSAAQLMQSFYSQLAQGRPKSAALRHAQLQLIQPQAGLAVRHPYFWAPFFLVGDTGPLT